MIFISVLQSKAHVPEEGKVFGTIGPLIHQVAPYHVRNSENSPTGIDLGILAEGDINSNGGVEVGVFYTSKTYRRAFDNSYLAERVQKLSVPFGYRYWLVPSLSGCLAFDASYTMGNPVVVFDNTPPGSGQTLARSTTEYGLDLSVQWEVFNIDRFALLLDARYFYSITSKSNEDANQYEALIGIKYLIQEKYGKE